MTDPGNLVSLLPHCSPLLLLATASMGGDRVLRARQSIPLRDPVLDGHFPGFPIWPGSLLAEAMAQTTAVWLLHERGPLEESEIPLLGSVECRFLRPVFPGEEIHYRTHLIRRIGDNGLFSVRATRPDGELVARGRFAAGIARRPPRPDPR